MKKFIIYSVKGSSSIMEVECEKLLDSKSREPALKEGEWLGKITSPKSLFEKKENGSLIEPIWCWWAFYDSVEEAMAAKKTQVTEYIYRTLFVKGSEIYSSELLESKVNEVIDKVQIILLK